MANDDGLFNYSLAGLDFDFDDFITKPMLENVMQKAVTKMEELIKDHFESRQAEWTPLAASTIRDRIRQGYGPNPLLVRSGNLRDNGAVTGVELDPTSEGIAGYVYTENPIALYQDLGTSRGIPSRPIYDLSDADQEQLFAVIDEALAYALGN